MALEAVWQAAAEDHLGAAFIQPGDSVIVGMRGSVRYHVRHRASRVEPRILRPMHRQEWQCMGRFYEQRCEMYIAASQHAPCMAGKELPRYEAGKNKDGSTPRSE